LRPDIFEYTFEISHSYPQKSEVRSQKSEFLSSVFRPLSGEHTTKTDLVGQVQKYL